MTDDLLAMLIEVSSVTASGRQLRKPIQVPRPKAHAPKKEPTGQPGNQTDAAFKRGVAVLAKSSRGVNRK